MNKETSNLVLTVLFLMSGIMLSVEGFISKDQFHMMAGIACLVICNLTHRALWHNYNRKI